MSPELQGDERNENVISPMKRRNQNACDACRARKVKCIYDGSICRSCLSLQIACTQTRPRKRRGPPNQYISAQLHQIQEPEPIIASPSISNPVMTSEEFSIGHLAPASIVQQMLADWFEFIHPLAPIVHRDTLLAQLAHPADSQDPDFMDLVISLCAATLATLRRRTSLYSQGMTVEKCFQAIMHHRHARLQNLQAPSLAWCQTMYNLSTSLGSERGIDDPIPQLLLVEALTGVGHLLHFELEHMAFAEQELLKRLYWLCFAGQCSLGLHCRPYMNLITPHLNTKAVTPLEITDAELAAITPGQEDWHGNTRSYIPGLNVLSQLFMMWHDSQRGDNHDLAHWRHWMHRLMSALDYIPPELRWRGGLSRPPRSNFGTDIQMVNLNITQIHIRSFLLDQMDRLAKDSNDADTIAEIVRSRQDLIHDMLAIVYQVPEDVLEANGYSLLPKMRDIGLALLNINSERDFIDLDRLLSKLERLDRTQQHSNFDPTSPVEYLTNPST